MHKFCLILETVLFAGALSGCKGDPTFELQSARSSLTQARTTTTEKPVEPPVGGTDGDGGTDGGNPPAPPPPQPPAGDGCPLPASLAVAYIDHETMSDVSGVLALSGARIEGDIYSIATRDSANVEGGAQVLGTLFREGASPEASVDVSSVLTGEVTTDLSSLNQKITDLHEWAKALQPTQSFPGGIWGQTAVIESDQHLNVIDVKHYFALYNGPITLHGSENDIFIFNIDGFLWLASGKILLSGGLTANHVLFNMVGDRATSYVYLDTRGPVSGTILAPKLSINAELTNMEGALIGADGFVRMARTGFYLRAKPFCPN